MNAHRISCFLLTVVVATAILPGRWLSAAEPEAKLTVVDVRKIWSAGDREANFTDLINFNGKLLCTFREGSSHASPDGIIRVLSSGDGQIWESIAELKDEAYDLRDPKLSIAPDGRLLLNGGATSYSPEGDDKTEREPLARHSFVSFSSDGTNWTAPRLVTTSEEDLWIWRVTWFRGMAYGVGKKFRERAILVTSQDGVDFKRHEPALLSEQWPNEATLSFTDDGNGYCLIRREGERNAEGKYSRANAFLGISEAPYESWKWLDTGIYLGGPNLIQLPDGRWIAGGRTRLPKAQMSLLELDVATGKLNVLLHLPSGGDCSYPGMVWLDDTLWVSYYSTHEGAHSEIYLARLQYK